MSLKGRQSRRIEEGELSADELEMQPLWHQNGLSSAGDQCHVLLIKFSSFSLTGVFHPALPDRAIMMVVAVLRADLCYERPFWAAQPKHHL